MKKNEFVLFERDCYTKEDYRLYCEDNGMEFEDKNVYDFYDWQCEMEEWDFENMLDNMKYSKLNNYSVLVEGSVGTWRGRFEHEQTTFPDFKSAIYACIGRSCEISKVVKIGNRVEVTAIHHDGRNYHTLYFLTPLGKYRFDKNGKVSVKNRENIIKIPNYMYE